MDTTIDLAKMTACNGEGCGRVFPRRYLNAEGLCSLCASKKKRARGKERMRALRARCTMERIQRKNEAGWDEDDLEEERGERPDWY